MINSNIEQGSWTDSFHQYRADIMNKIKRGETEDSIAIGGSSFTQTEWKRALKSVDKHLEDIKEEQRIRFEKEGDRAEAVRAYEAAVAGKGSAMDSLHQVSDVPYGYMAKDGVIEYNGVVFVCDSLTNSICLGDVSDKENTLTIPLEAGGCLKVNRNNLDELQKAIGMFSPEDVNRILRAITKDRKTREMAQELEETESTVTDLGAEDAAQVSESSKSKK